MRRTTLLAALGLFVVGAVSTGFLRGSDTPSPVSTTTTTTTTPLATWVDEAEIVLPPAVIVPLEVSHEGGLVVIDYELVGMAGGEAPLRPTHWTLLTTAAEIPAQVDASATRVAFDVGFDFDPATITGLRLDEYVLRSPIQAPFQPSPDDFTAHRIAPGITASLDVVQEQSTGTIVRVQLSADRLGAVADLAAEGVGPGWVTASSNFGGGGLWTLSFDGDDLPDPLPLQVRGMMWIPLEASAISTLEGVPRG